MIYHIVQRAVFVLYSWHAISDAGTYLSSGCGAAAEGANVSKWARTLNSTSRVWPSTRKLQSHVLL